MELQIIKRSVSCSNSVYCVAINIAEEEFQLFTSKREFDCNIQNVKKIDIHPTMNTRKKKEIKYLI